MLDRIKDLSRVAHDLIWTDKSQSLCARAWQKQDDHAFWLAWTFVFGRQHCERSFDHWNERHPK